MIRPPSSTGHAPSGAVRVVTGLALGLLLIVTIAAGLGTGLRVRAPEAALRMAPWNAQAAGRLSQQLLVTDKSQHDRAARLADQALRRDPTIVMAVVTRGVVAQEQGHARAALRAFTYAEWLSRRSLPTELWWIEYGVDKDDIAFVLHHMDIALRAVKQAPDVLFPVLGNAVTQAEIRRELIAVFRRGPAWMTRFLRWLVDNGVNNRGAAALVTEMTGAGVGVDAALMGQLEGRLVEEGDRDTAWNLYRSRHPRSTRTATRDDDFASGGTSASPFDWDVVDEHGTAAISRMGNRYVLTFTTLPTSGGVLARQLQLLPPGPYRLTSDATMESSGAGSRPYWMLTCIDGRELGRLPLQGSQGAKSAIVVPPGCPAQWLALSVDGSDAVEGVSGTVRTISLASEMVR